MTHDGDKSIHTGIKTLIEEAVLPAVNQKIRMLLLQPAHHIQIGTGLL